MGDVLEGKFNKDEVSAEKVIEGAVIAELDPIIIIGWRKSDRKLYAASSTDKYSDILTLLEITKKFVLDDYVGE